MSTGTELRSITAGLAGAATPHQVLLTGGPISLRVSSASPGPLTALAAATTPYLRPTGPDHPQRTDEVAELIRIHADPVLDHPGPATDRVALRVVRGIAGRCLITAGWVALHAAAALTRAGLIVLAGPSGAGKTTALLQLLAGHLGHAFVANDKVYLSIGDDGVHSQALPTSLALRPDTLAMFPPSVTQSPRRPSPTSTTTPAARVPTDACSCRHVVSPTSSVSRCVPVARSPRSWPSACSALTARHDGGAPTPSALWTR